MPRRFLYTTVKNGETRKKEKKQKRKKEKKQMRKKEMEQLGAAQSKLLFIVYCA